MSNYNNQVRKDDLKFLAIIVTIFLFVAWLCSPPGNKILQICFWGNETKLLLAQVTKSSESTEYLFHRNNAVYLAKMFPKDKRKAMREINKAIATLPSYEPDKVLQSLYKDRAYIELYYGDRQGALNDFLRSGELTITDYLPVALLFIEKENYHEAISYCNAILNIDTTAYAGYACMSHLYVKASRPDLSEKVWDVAIDRKPNNPKFYLERYKVKMLLGNEISANDDLLKAKEYLPNIDVKKSLVDETLNPKILNLTIK